MKFGCIYTYSVCFIIATLILLRFIMPICQSIYRNTKNTSDLSKQTAIPSTEYVRHKQRKASKNSEILNPYRITSRHVRFKALLPQSAIELRPYSLTPSVPPLTPWKQTSDRESSALTGIFLLTIVTRRARFRRFEKLARGEEMALRSGEKKGIHLFSRFTRAEIARETDV